MEKKSMALTIKPTNLCNFRCKHCFNGENLEEKGMLPLSTVFQTLELIAKKYNDIKITFHGGEPTLAGINYYKEIFSYEKILEKKYNVEFWHIFQTNGYLLDSDFIDLLISEDVLISISFDGFHNDILRSNTDSVLAKIEEVKSKNGRMRIFCVETAKSIDSLLETYEWFKKRELNYKILPIQPRGFAENEKDMILEPNNYIENLMKVYRIWLEDKERINIMYTFEEFLKLKDKEVFKTKWFERKLSLNPDGFLYPFGRPYDVNFNLGKPDEIKDIDECFFNKNYLKLREILDFKIMNECTKCNVFSTCNGTCLCSSFVYGNDKEMLKYACLLARTTFSNVIKINSEVKKDILDNKSNKYNTKVKEYFNEIKTKKAL